MSKFQVVSLKPMSGIAKTSGKPYVMLIVTGLFTNDDGTMEVGEVIFMEGVGRPLPTGLMPGQTYTPVIEARSRQGRLTFEIGELKPIVVAAGGKPAAVAA
jgi:hypothetical protein